MRKQPSSQNGFTLIEMIAVIAIIAIVTVFVVPSVSSLFRASQLTQAATMLTDQVNLGRQQAVTKNCSVEVRFIRFADPETPGESVTDPTTGQFRAIQLMQILPSGVAVPLAKASIFPSAAVLNSGTNGTATSTNWPPSAPPSSLLSSAYPQGSGSLTDFSKPVYTSTPANSDPDMPRGVNKNYDYYAFRFLADGSTTLQPTVPWWITVNLINDLPKLTSSAKLQNVNFFTLQIDAASGGTRSYRPTAG